MRISDWSSDVCSSDLERWLAKIALAPVAYGHFFVEHNRGHHVRVATPEDPATSRFGEHFHEFLPRSMIGSVKSAWELERKRLARQNKGVWSVANENLQAWAMTEIGRASCRERVCQYV